MRVISRFIRWVFRPVIEPGADGRRLEVKRFGRMIAVLPRFAGAAIVKRLARGWVFEVESVTPNTWIAMGGVNNFGVSRDKVSADTTDFNSGGNATHLPAQRSRSLTVDCYFLEDAVTPFARDPGQERVETLSDAVGDAGIGKFRWKSPSTKVWTASGSFNVSGQGGGNNDATSWSLEFESSGATALT